MMRPPSPWRTNCRAAACDRKKTAFRFRSMTSSQSFSVKSSASARRMMPALLTSTSSRPNSATTCASSVTGSASRRSASMLKKRRPVSPINLSVSTGVTTLMPAMSHPARARASAMPCPSPVSQPVTTATFPVRSNIGVSFSGCWRRRHGPCRRRSGSRQPCPR